MSTYKITSPSGQHLSITGDTPPTQEQLDQIFKNVPQGNQQSSQQPPLMSLLQGNPGQAASDFGSRLNDTLSKSFPTDSELSNARQTGNWEPVTQKNFQLASGPATATAVSSTAGGVKDLLGYLTKKGIGEKIGAKVAQSTASGANNTWSDFATEVRQAVTKKLGNDQPYQNIVNSRLSAETPTSIAESPTVNAQDLQNFRIQAANRIPKGIFQKFQGHSPSDQVDEIIRQVASSRLKDLAGTGNLDKLFSVYSKFGSPAEIARNAVVGGITSALVPDQYKAQVGGVTGGGLELLKILGGL